MDTNVTVHITRTGDSQINVTLPSENRKKGHYSQKGLKLVLHLIGKKIREEVRVQETRPIETPDNFPWENKIKN